MSGFYHQRPYIGGGPISKKPRMGPRGPPHMMGGPGGPPGHGMDEEGKRLMSFKEFILAQSNDITEREALDKYGDYKTDFTRRQIDKFFKEHQDEEWFRNKYRPTEIKKTQEAVKESKAKRKEFYDQLVKKYESDQFSLDYQHQDKLSKFLEDFSLLLEGASFEDLENPEIREKFTVSSIFLKDVHQSIDKAMIEEFASQHPGFLRVAMSEADPLRGFKRRAWITYKQTDHDSLKKLTWTYNAHKFNGQDTSSFVNREMKQRIRFTQFWFCHTKAAKADLKNVAKLLTHFDGEDCPLLESVKEYLIEETNEEEKILGVSEENVPTFEFAQDQEIFKALDRVILYLRVVHSYDYYASTEYSGEDDMPQKVGIMFARPMPPSTYGDQPEVLLKEFIQAQQTRIDSFLQKPTLSETEQKQLGKRNSEEEVENFIYQHTFEKKPGEKYVCKITKKKFTAPEYVRKHIITRCGDKLDEVRTEVEFFNNYVADPERPIGVVIVAFEIIQILMNKMTGEKSEAIKKVIDETIRLYSSLLPDVLQESQLARPTFKFIQDLVKNLITETRTLRDVFNPSDFDTERKTWDRRKKIEFIQRLSNHAAKNEQPVTGCVAAKVVAGLEPIKTNELLQALARLALNKKSARPRTFTRAHAPTKQKAPPGTVNQLPEASRGSIPSKPNSAGKATKVERRNSQSKLDSQEASAAVTVTASAIKQGHPPRDARTIQHQQVSSTMPSENDIPRQMPQLRLELKKLRETLSDLDVLDEQLMLSFKGVYPT